jgi:hypothetical protein
MTIGHTACPAAIVEAPVGVVWKPITNLAAWGSFFDVRVISVQRPGPAVPGQRMRGESGPHWLHLGVSFEFTLVDEKHFRLEMDGSLPLGLTVHEALNLVWPKTRSSVSLY